MFFMASISFNIWNWGYINKILQWIRIIPAYIFSLFHQEKLIWLPLFWLKLLFWRLMYDSKEEFLLRLFNYETMMSLLPLSIPPFNVMSYKLKINLKIQKGLGTTLRPEILTQLAHWPKTYYCGVNAICKLMYCCTCF